MLLIFFCSVNLFRHVKVVQEALLLYRKDGVSIYTADLQRKVQIVDLRKRLKWRNTVDLLTMLKHMAAMSQSFLLKNLQTKKCHLSLDQLPLEEHCVEFLFFDTFILYYWLTKHTDTVEKFVVFC